MFSVLLNFFILLEATIWVYLVLHLICSSRPPYYLSISSSILFVYLVLHLVKPISCFITSSRNPPSDPPSSRQVHLICPSLSIKSSCISSISSIYLIKPISSARLSHTPSDPPSHPPSYEDPEVRTMIYSIITLFLYRFWLRIHTRCKTATCNKTFSSNLTVYWMKPKNKDESVELQV